MFIHASLCLLEHHPAKVGVLYLGRVVHGWWIERDEALRSGRCDGNKVETSRVDTHPPRLRCVPTSPPPSLHLTHPRHPSPSHSRPPKVTTRTVSTLTGRISTQLGVCELHLLRRGSNSVVLLRSTPLPPSTQPTSSIQHAPYAIKIIVPRAPFK